MLWQFVDLSLTLLPGAALREGRAVNNTNKFYYTYVLKSVKDDKIYIGWTDDLKARVRNHNSGMVLSTKFRRPLDLVYYVACITKNKSIKREKYFKTGFGRRFLKNRI